ncbi:MAG: pantetheine-phosphate adenylyltransferase [Candidatus Lokiarchaeota archaeon]|nr:pantetheine-phosphate adenylyltransferase [Candidatus Lokiarchaeota archaeon]
MLIKLKEIIVVEFPFKLCGIGGTFDHLHKGHKLLIKTAFKLGKKVVIGLTTEEMIKHKKFQNFIENYEKRKENLLSYIADLNPDNLNRCDIIPLNDPFGPAISTPELEVHVSSEESYKMAMRINQIREENGLNKMILVIIPAVLNKDGDKISSSDIRARLDPKE